MGAGAGLLGQYVYGQTVNNGGVGYPGQQTAGTQLPAFTPTIGTTPSYNY